MAVIGGQGQGRVRKGRGGVWRGGTFEKRSTSKVVAVKK